MFIALGLTFLGMALGFLLRGQPWITSLTRCVTPAIMLLLFALGISVGSNELLMQSLPRLGGAALALTVALVLGFSRRSGLLERWPDAKPLAFLGKISYSVFLVHFAVCLVVNTVVGRLWPDAPLTNLLGMGLAFVLSLAAGRQLHVRVEQHVPSWSTALRWQMGLVGTGMLMAGLNQWA